MGVCLCEVHRKKKHDKKYHQSDRSFTTHCAASGPLATKPWAAARETASLSSKADVKALTVNGQGMEPSNWGDSLPKMLHIQMPAPWDMSSKKPVSLRKGRTRIWYDLDTSNHIQLLLFLNYRIWICTNIGTYLHHLSSRQPIQPRLTCAHLP